MRRLTLSVGLPFLILGAAAVLLPARGLASALQDCVKMSGDDAIRACTEAIRKSPRVSALFYNRGIEYRRKKLFERAIADFDEALKLAPTDIDTLTTRGNTYRDMEDFDRARSDFDRAIRLKPKNPEPLIYRGNLHQMRGDPDSAIADYSRALDLTPKDGDIFSNRAYAYLAKGDTARSVTDGNQAVALTPGFNSFMNRGVANLYNGSETQAAADFNQAAKLDPTDRYILLWTEILDKRRQLASKLFEAASRIDMTKWPAPLIRLYLGELTFDSAFSAADDSEAMVRLRQQCDVSFYGGKLALTNGMNDEAKRLFERAVGHCPKAVPEWVLARLELRLITAR